jgi:hypothetical protein
MKSSHWLTVAVLLGAACSRTATPVAQPVAADAHTAAQPSPASPSIAECCRQCLQASQRDPAGVDISLRPCSRYQGQFGGAPGVDAGCLATLQSQQATVQSCRAQLEPSAK